MARGLAGGMVTGRDAKSHSKGTSQGTLGQFCSASRYRE